VKVALDTNILAYAEGVNGLDRRRAAFLWETVTEAAPLLLTQVKSILDAD
jgi:hypothetical protein